MIPVRVGTKHDYVQREVTDEQYAEFRNLFRDEEEHIGLVGGWSGEPPTVIVSYFTGTLDEFESLFGPPGVVAPLQPPTYPVPPVSVDTPEMAMLREIHEDIHKLSDFVAGLATGGRRIPTLGPVDELDRR